MDERDTDKASDDSQGKVHGVDPFVEEEPNVRHKGGEADDDLEGKRHGEDEFREIYGRCFTW